MRSFRVWDTFKKHIYRGCKEKTSNITTSEDCGDIDYNDEDCSGCSEADNHSAGIQ